MKEKWEDLGTFSLFVTFDEVSGREIHYDERFNTRFTIPMVPKLVDEYPVGDLFHDSMSHNMTNDPTNYPLIAQESAR